jgi:uncharacterized protein YdaU (DUF1376 family)
MSMNGLPWYQRFPRDLIEGTVGMPYDVKMQYWALLDLIYLYNNALPDDANFICGTFNCSKQLWRKVRAELVSREKVQINNGIISNKRAENILESSKKYSNKQANNRANPNKNNTLPTPEPSPDAHQKRTKVEPPQPHTQEQGLKGILPSNPKKEEEGAQARASISVFQEVMLAVGVDPDKPPKFWRGSAATTHVLGWQLVHNLTDDELVEVARLSRRDNPEPPDGPKALDRHMAAFAKAKASAGGIKPASPSKAAPVHKPVDRQAVAAFWAAEINKGAYVSASAIRPDVARDMLAAKLVTPEQLREKGIAA